MIVATGISVASTSLFPGAEAGAFDVRTAAIFAVLLFGTIVWERILKKRFEPILLILFAAALGIGLFGI